MNKRPPAKGRNAWLTYLEILIGKRKEESQRATLIRGSGGTFALKIGSVILGFAVSISLTRILGSHGYGIYAYAMAWVNVLAIVATLGMHGVLVRQMAIYQSQDRGDLLRGMVRFSTYVAIGASLAILAIAYLGTWTWQDAIDPELRSALWTALLIIPVYALVKMRESAMMGLQRAVMGQMPNMLIQPAVFLVLVWLAYLVINGALTPMQSLLLQLAAVFATLIVGSRWLSSTLSKIYSKNECHYEIRPWLASAMPLLFVQCMQVINNKANIVLLGTLDTMQSVGIYSVASQVSSLISFVLLAVNAPLAPVIARLHSNGETSELQKVITKSARLVLFVSLPIAVFFMLYGDWVLSFFGQDFTAGAQALAILATGQLINVAMGSVGVILVMTGHEKTVAASFSLAAALNLTLSAALIPQWGIMGAATATACSIIIWNTLLMLKIRRFLKIDTTALGSITKRLTQGGNT